MTAAVIRAGLKGERDSLWGLEFSRYCGYPGRDYFRPALSQGDYFRGGAPGDQTLLRDAVRPAQVVDVYLSLPDQLWEDLRAEITVASLRSFLRPAA